MEIVQWPTGNYGYPRGTHGRNGEAAVAICDHIMQGYQAGYHAYLADPDRNSAHFSVYLDGHVEQHVLLSDAAWCNGPMAAPDLSVPWIKRCWEGKVNPNLVTVSIEHEGLTGEPWPEAQIKASIELHRYILDKCPTILPDRAHIVGHNQIDSVNKSACPGTAFPWARIMEAVKAVSGPSLDFAGAGVRAYLQAHPELGLPRFQNYTDAKGNEYDWLTPSAAYPDGPLLVWRAWTPSGEDHARIVSWQPEASAVDRAGVKARLEEAKAKITEAEGLLGQ